MKLGKGRFKSIFESRWKVKDALWELPTLISNALPINPDHIIYQGYAYKMTQMNLAKKKYFIVTSRYIYYKNVNY